jgi:RNA polymerase sigma-70 factor (ECF subfamily)
MRDNELIQRTKAHKPGAFDELYFAYVDRVARHLYKVVGPDSDLEDLVQQTFVQVYKRIDTFREDASFGTWLHRVALNVALSHLRKRSRWLRPQTSDIVLPLPMPVSEQPDESVSRREKQELLDAALTRIKPKKRMVFVLYEIEGHTLEEISTLVDAPVNTVAARLRAARQEMRRALEKRLATRPIAVA